MSVIVAANLSFFEWPSVPGDRKMTVAPFFRLTHHCEIVEIGDENYGFGQHSKVRSGQAAAPPPKSKKSEKPAPALPFRVRCSRAKPKPMAKSVRYGSIPQAGQKKLIDIGTPQA